MIFKPRTAVVLTDNTPKSRTLSLTVDPPDATCFLEPMGDRPVTPIRATGTGHQSFLVPGDIPAWGADLVVSAPGYLALHRWIPSLPLTDTELDAVTLEEDYVPLPRIEANGGFFTVDGQPWTWIGCTDFMLFKRYVDGQDIEPILEQRAALGFNILRVFFSCDWMFRLRPADHADFYQEAGDFFRLCAKHGLYVEAVAFADTQRIFPDLQSQLLHWFGLATYAESNVVLELVNENNVHENGVANAAAFPKCDHVLCSRGSNGAGSEPVRPEMDYETFHWNDLSEWTRKCAHNPMEDGTWKTGKPAVSDENTRFPDRCADAQMAFDAAAGAALLCAGSTFHSEPGKYSLLFSEPTLSFARAWTDGARSVPLEFQRGRYQRIDDPNYLRTYQRILPDGRAHTVRIHR